MEPGSFFRLKVTNLTSTPVHLYMILIDGAGRLQPGTLWFDRGNLKEGIQPGKSEFSVFFQQDGEVGMNEIRLFSAPEMVLPLLSPPAAATRGVSRLEDGGVDPSDLQSMRMKIIRYTTISTN
jgi:hypothetical protein